LLDDARSFDRASIRADKISRPSPTRATKGYALSVLTAEAVSRFSTASKRPALRPFLQPEVIFRSKKAMTFIRLSSESAAMSTESSGEHPSCRWIVIFHTYRGRGGSGASVAKRKIVVERNS
jgi:hypothetical protein